MRTLAIALLTVVATLAVGCGSPDKRQECSGPGQCPVGQYCAAEGVCWPDAVSPTITSVTVTCGPPCTRDGVANVSVVADDTVQLAAVRVRLDLDPTRVVTLAKSGAGYTGQLALAQWPFPTFERAVTVTVEAEDGARNVTTEVKPGAATVTRLKWVYDGIRTDVGVAVYPDGSVLSASEGTDRLVRIGVDGLKRWGALAGTGVFGTPSIGNGVAWVGDATGSVFAIGDDGTVLNGAGCATGGTAVVPPAVNAAGNLAFAASQTGALYAVDAASRCTATQVTNPYNAPAVLLADGTIAAASTGPRSLLRNFSLLPAGFRENWTGSPPPPDIGLDVTAGPAIDGEGRVWTLSTDGKLNVTTPAAVTTPIRTLGGSGAGPVILSDGSLVTGDLTRILRRLTAAGADVWSSPPDLLGTPQTPLVLTGGNPELIVPTAGGKLFALHAADGSEAWSTQLVPGNGALRPGNIHTPAGSALSMGYFPAANGKLYAVVLDGRLDAAAPWPKAFHDPRNTGNAATPIP